MLNSFSEMTIRSYREYFDNLFDTNKPLIKLFRTQANGYIYDTGTSKILQCEDVEYQILDTMLSKTRDDFFDNLTEKYGKQRVIEAFKNIKNAVDGEHILQSVKPQRFISPGHFERLENEVNHGLEQLVLEVTEACNLRCGYCIYGAQFTQKREHGEVNMSMEIARAAIDYLEKHAKPGHAAVTFYGGEPLLRFDFLKDCVKYAQDTITRPELYFSLTTNLTMVTEEIAQYLASIDNLSLVCSIDGPQEIHDSYRKDIKGNGSFEKAIQGLRYLVDALGDKISSVLTLSMVFAPPYSIEKLEQINNFFNELEWLPSDVPKTVTYPATNSVFEQTMETQTVSLENIKIESVLAKWSSAQFMKQIEDDNIKFFTQKNVTDSLIIVHKRDIFEEPVEQYPFNGCCLPACRRLYVTAQGNFLLCERIDGAPFIGNVFTGLDFPKLKSIFVDEYSEASIKYCSDCWAVRICNMCYTNCFSDGQLDLANKNLHCLLTRDSLESGLISYHEYMEKDPEKLKFLNDMIRV